jgi:hypothetical protein
MMPQKRQVRKGGNMSYSSAFDSLFNEVGQAFGFDPMLLKTIAIKESGINPNVADNHNGNGSADIGMMQINNRDPAYQKYGYDKLKNDPKTSITAAAETLQTKAAMLKRMGEAVNNYNLLHAYNGWSAQGAKYADDAINIYNNISGNSKMTEAEKARRGLNSPTYRTPPANSDGTSSGGIELGTIQQFVRVGVYILILVMIVFIFIQAVPKPMDAIIPTIKGGKL